jgi:hypothetical protein
MNIIIAAIAETRVERFHYGQQRKFHALSVALIFTLFILVSILALNGSTPSPNKTSTCTVDRNFTMSSSTRSNQHEQQRVHEDLPEYRSVMMHPLVPPPMPRSFGPPAKLARTARVSSEPFASSKQSIDLSQSTTWKIIEPVELPAGYLLDRTNVYVDNAAAQTVADRICTCLREQSIAYATSNPDDEKVRLSMSHAHDASTKMQRGLLPVAVSLMVLLS